jgi:hypothetical protein
MDYSKKKLPELIKLADEVFHKFIRLRDRGKPCISCDSFDTTDATHFYSAGKHPELRYHEDNVHAWCIQCNRILSGNLYNYKKRLPGRIGIKKYTEIYQRVEMFKQIEFKYDRSELIDIIIKYKSEVKKLEK